MVGKNGFNVTQSIHFYQFFILGFKLLFFFMFFKFNSRKEIEQIPVVVEMDRFDKNFIPLKQTILLNLKKNILIYFQRNTLTVFG